MPTLQRRTLLKSAVGAAALAIAPERRTEAGTTESSTPKPAPSVASFQEKLTGPILSIPTPFTSDFRVDFPAVTRMAKQAIKAGIGVFALTSGDGQYQWLEYDEIKQLARTLVEAVAGKGIVISAAGGWWTGQCIDYARFAEKTGADAVQILLPEIGDEAAVVDHFKAIIDATALPIVLHGNYSVSLLEKLVALPSLAALKEDVTLDYYIDRQRRFGKRLVIFGGGTEYRYIVAQPYGAKAYYSAYAAFAPAESMRFWELARAGRLTEAAAWASKFDHPFLEKWSHAFWRASCEHFGTASRYMRPPNKSFTDAQMKDVKAFFDGVGLHAQG